MAAKSGKERKRESWIQRERQNGINIIKWKWREEVHGGKDETD